MKETAQQELARLLLNHARMISGKSAAATALAGTPSLLQQATSRLESGVRKLARGVKAAEKSALLAQLAAENPGLNFQDTRNLLGL